MAAAKRLPKGFRYLFTLKEVRAIASAASINFHSISTGNITASQHLQPDSFFQGSFHSPSIQAYQIATGWQFNFHQAGFRAELLPLTFEASVKTEIQNKFTAFLQRVLMAKETDFLRAPSLLAHVFLANDKISVSYSEHK